MGLSSQLGNLSIHGGGERERAGLARVCMLNGEKKTRENEILRFNLLALAAFGFCFRYFGYFGTRREQVGERN
jgi:hypothetical protein